MVADFIQTNKQAGGVRHLLQPDPNTVLKLARIAVAACQEVTLGQLGHRHFPLTLT
jgi:hypothetical protein